MSGGWDLGVFGCVGVLGGALGCRVIRDVGVEIYLGTLGCGMQDARKLGCLEALGWGISGSGGIGVQ